jgi:hypothetical protein
MALVNLMRLSLMKAAYAVVSGAAWQEIRVRSVEKHFPQGLKPTVLPPPICTG